jgi:hypothetical protein
MERFYEDKNNFDRSFDGNFWHQRAIVRANECAIRKPKDPLLHLPDASVSQIGQTRQLPYMWHEP